MSSGELLASSVQSWIEGDAILPAAPDDPQPRTGEDPDCVWVAATAVDGSLVDIGRPGIGTTTSVGKVHDGRSKLLVAGPAEHGLLTLA